MNERQLFWLGSSYEELMKIPEEIKDIFGYALDPAQRGERPPKAKPFHLDGESGLIEVV